MEESKLHIPPLPHETEYRLKGKRPQEASILVLRSTDCLTRMHSRMGLAAIQDHIYALLLKGELSSL